jgi:type I restriction-modification system DNA methylase subunit
MTSPEMAYEQVEALVKRFKATPATQRKGMNEMQTRLGFILPLFSALGWDTSNINEVSPEEKVSRGWVDFSFRLGGVPRFFLETKRVNEDLNDPRWIKQTIDYAWTKSVTWALLSDFEGLRVFNAEVRVDNPFQAEFLAFNLDSYLTDFERLWWLSRHETLAGRLNTEAEKWGKKMRRQPVSQHLFDDLKQWRMALYKDLTGYNMLSGADADNAVLRILNRLIFIRTSEDRLVEEPILRPMVRTLKDQKRFQDLARELSLKFRELDAIYNSELFAPHFSEGLYISPTVLEEVINGLYEKNYMIYNFNAIESDVLGTAYEQYLGAVVAKIPEPEIAQGQLFATDTMSVQERRQKRKSQGIYYTPTFVTKYIVKETVGKWLAEHGYNPSRPPRILDMACGSGSFLIEAFDDLDTFVADQRGHLREDTASIFDYARQMEVLTNCIYGVDKDKQAVEVARLNLLLRALHTKDKLPLLTNIFHGDSLRPETWQQGFDDVMKAGGFDIIIGNPPYVRIQTLAKDEVEYFNQNFVSATGNYDIYVLFVEQALNLLKPGGVMGFILPNKFMQTDYGEGLRKLLSEQKAINKIVNFGDAQIFENATTYTCFLFLKKSTNETFSYSLAEEVIKSGSVIQLDNNDLSFFEVEANRVDSDPWMLANESQNRIMSKLLDGNLLMGDIAKRMFQGIRTSGNEVYVLDFVKDLGNAFELRSKSLGKVVKLEKGLLKPFLRGEDIKAYSIAQPTKYVLIPYSVQREKAELLSQAELQKDFPLIWDYLIENREFLENREYGKMKHDAWYAFVYPKNLDQFGLSKIITPDIAPKSSFALDDEGNFTFVSGYGITLKPGSDYSLKFILALLNSHAIDFYLKKISSRLQQGFYRYFSQYIAQLPIRRIDFANPAEKAAYDEIVGLVEEMLNLQKECATAESALDDRRFSLSKRIEQIDAEINRRVYALYGLTDDEIRLVEGK